VVTVDIAGADTSPEPLMDADQARLAVQGLVWTATAASGADGVRLLLDGRPADVLFGHEPAGGVLRRAPRAEVVAPLWLIDPQQAARLGKEVEVRVAGSVSEATVRLRVLHDNEVVTERTLTLSAGAPEVGEATTTVSLSPGVYTFEVFAPSAVDGSPMHRDDHMVTVGSR
jgi:hypothetical protein